LQETFVSFLRELEDSNFAECSGKELLEKEVLRIMRKEGFSEQQTYKMPLRRLLDLFYNAYICEANIILSKSTKTTFI
jgi:hypothetical protein